MGKLSGKVALVTGASEGHRRSHCRVSGWQQVLLSR